MPDLRISQIAELTGLSMRYWQRRAAANDMPGVRFIETGNRRIYFVDRDSFAPWWQKQLKDIGPCRKTSENVGRFGGIASPKTGSRTKVALERTTSDSLKSAFKEYAKS